MKKLFIVFIIPLVLLTNQGCLKKATNSSQQINIESESSFVNDEEEKDIIKNLYVNSENGLRVRDAPDGDLLFILQNGSKVSQIEPETEKNKAIIDGVEGYWLKIRFYSDEGWVFNTYLVDDFFDVIEKQTKTSLLMNYSNLEYVENEYDRILNFIKNPIINLPRYHFGFIMTDLETSRYSLSVNDLINAISEFEKNIKMYSKSGPQGGNRWDTIVTDTLEIEYSRQGDDITSNIHVMNITIYKNTKYKLQYFDRWPSISDMKNVFGNYNNINENWNVYSMQNGNVSLGFYIMNNEIEAIRIRQYLSD